MPSTTAGATAVKDVLAELESLGDEKRRQYNAKVGPDGIRPTQTMVLTFFFLDSY